MIEALWSLKRAENTPNHTLAHPWAHESSAALPWEPKIFWRDGSLFPGRFVFIYLHFFYLLILESDFNFTWMFWLIYAVCMLPGAIATRDHPLFQQQTETVWLNVLMKTYCNPLHCKWEVSIVLSASRGIAGKSRCCVIWDLSVGKNPAISVRTVTGRSSTSTTWYHISHLLTERKWSKCQMQCVTSIFSILTYSFVWSMLYNFLLKAMLNACAVIFYCGD
jgi:hypothetical protein